MMPMGPWILFVWLLFLALIVAGAVLVVRAFSDRSGPGHDRRGDREALRILEERYARGEMDREEFEERRRVLGS